MHAVNRQKIRLAILAAVALSLASFGAVGDQITAQTGPFIGTINAVPGTTVTINGLPFYGQFGSGAATGDTGTGFAGVPDNTGATFGINPGFIIDAARTAQSQTQGAINSYYAYGGAGNAYVFSSGLAGLEATVNTDIVAHAAVAAGPLPSNISGTATLVNTGATGSALAFFNAVDTLTGGTDLLSFTGSAADG